MHGTSAMQLTGLHILENRLRSYRNWLRGVAIVLSIGMMLVGGFLLYPHYRQAPKHEAPIVPRIATAVAPASIATVTTVLEPVATWPVPAVPPDPGVGQETVSSRFQEARLCARALTAKGTMERVLKICDDNRSQPRNAENKAYFEFCRGRALEFARSLPAAERDLQRCATRDPQEAAEKFHDDTVQAALAGDADAQICYLRSQFGLERPLTREEEQQYAETGPLYIQRALESGDWRIIELLSKAAPGRTGKLVPTLQHAVAFEPVNPYRMNRLLRRGATGEKYVHFLDALAPHHAEGLSVEQRAQSDQWAQETYDLHFSRSPRLEKAPSTCMGDMMGYDPDSY